MELFRECQAKIEGQQRRSLSFEDRDSELRRVMATEDKLHPALFSPESEHKVFCSLSCNLELLCRVFMLNGYHFIAIRW